MICLVMPAPISQSIPAAWLIPLQNMTGLRPQSNELTKGTTELVQHFRLLGSSHRRKSLTQIWYGLAISLAYSSGEADGILPVQMISTYLCCAYRGGGSAPCVYACILVYFRLCNPIQDMFLLSEFIIQKQWKLEIYIRFFSSSWNVL